MKKLILVLILTLSLANAGDNQKHAGYSFVLGATGAMIAEKYGATPTEAFFWGLGTVLVIGLAKEASDSRDGGTGFDSNDMLANALGGSLGAGTGIVLMKFSTGRW